MSSTGDGQGKVMATEDCSTMVSGRASRFLKELDQIKVLSKYQVVVGNDPYHPKDNPQGYLSMGVAENKLCEELTLQKLKSLDLREKEEISLQYYPADVRGEPSFRQALADLLNNRFQPRVKIDPEELIVSCGTTAMMDTLALSLADAGDYFLVPTPCYYRVPLDLGTRAEVKKLEVPLSAETGFDLNVKSFEAAYAEARKQGKVVKGILLINPDNPTGNMYTAQVLSDILRFASDNQLHVVSDEIFALTVFDKKTQFTSILSLPHPDPQRVHFLWGVSKDLGLSGYKCGLLYTRNTQLLRYATEVGNTNFQCPPLQRKLQNIICDYEWLDSVYFPTLHKRLSAAHRLACDKLSDMGVHIHPSRAGIFIWADFSKFLSEPTFKAEEELFLRFLNARVHILSGKENYCPCPGWFRILFALEHEVLTEGLRRIETVLKSLPVPHQSQKKMD